jgi:glycosyltransferase involved in cell wall biosynthesis
MSRDQGRPFLVWIYGGHLDQAMDSATWLDTSLELRKMGWQVLLVSAGPSSLKSINGTEVYCLPMTNIYLVRQLVYHLGIYWLLLHYRLGMDIILFDQLSAIWLLPVKLVSKLMRKRRPLFVIDIRSLFMSPPGRQGLKGWLRGRFQEFVGREARHWVNGYLTITSRLADFIQTPKDMLWGTWPSGVSLNLFKDIPQAHFWPSQSDPVRLIYIGTLNIERNLMNFCRAVEQANTKGMSFELWLVGDGDERECLVEYARETHERIKVKRPVPHGDVPQLLAQAHVGVLPLDRKSVV